MWLELDVKIRRLALLGLLLTGAGASGPAAAFAEIVFDPANFGRNAITAGETIKQTLEQVRANALNLQQVQELLAARKQLSDAQLDLTGGLSTLEEVARRAAEVRALLQSLQSLSGNIDNLQTRFNVRFNAAQALGLGLAAYYEQVKLKAQAGAQRVQAEIDADRQALEKVSSAHEQVLKWTSTIRGIDSQVAGLSVLGSQMNVMVAQNAQLMSFLVRGNQARQQALVDEQEKAQREADEDLQVNEEARAAYRRSRDELLNSLRVRARQGG